MWTNISIRSDTAWRDCVLLTLFVFLSVTTVCAQNAVTWDSLSRPAIYESRALYHKALPKSSEDVVFLGNSITFWGDWSAFLDNHHVKNYGIPGDNTYGVLERLEPIVQGQPAKIFVMIGINDLGRNIPEDVIVANCVRIMKRIRQGSPSTKVYFQSILPTNAKFGKLKHLQNKHDRIQYVNEELKKKAKSLDVNWVDLYSVFTDKQGNLIEQYTYDGVHLTYRGYETWVNALKQVVDFGL